MELTKSNSSFKNKSSFNFFKNENKKISIKRKIINIVMILLGFLCIDFFLLSVPIIGGWVSTIDTHGIYANKDLYMYKKLNEEISKSDFSIKSLNFSVINSNFSSSSLELSNAVYKIKMNPLIDKNIKKEAILIYNKNYLNGFNVQKNEFKFPKCGLGMSCNLFSYYYNQEKNQLDKDTLLQLETNKKIINDEVKYLFDNKLNVELIEKNMLLFNKN